VFNGMRLGFSYLLRCVLTKVLYINKNNFSFLLRFFYNFIVGIPKVVGNKWTFYIESMFSTFVTVLAVTITNIETLL
jgi:hypothetical protein